VGSGVCARIGSESEKMTNPKRIILLLDGTWNDADYGPADTNIVRLRQIIGECLDPTPLGSELLTPISAPNQASVTKRNFVHDGAVKEHLVFYERGVGTGGFMDAFFGGAMGAGLARNVRRAYKFLSRNYAKNDEVFIFGFSRGSYTARSLVGLISAVGLLERQNCTEHNESDAWYYYRTSPADRFSIKTDRLRDLSHRDFSVTCLAVFDTVGALGVPIRWFWRENRDLFEFHDVSLSSSTKLNLHALAVDEHRESFEAALWRQQKFGSLGSTAEQVWFPGAHSDVGGGYIDEEGRSDPELDDLPLDWMLKRILEKHEDFPVRKNGVDKWRPVSPLAALAPQHEARNSFYRTMPFALRSIENKPVPNTGWFERNVSRDRHADPVGESLHRSVIERLGKTVLVGRGRRRYAPKNVIAYLNAGLPSIVDWNGSVLPRAQSANLVAQVKANYPDLGIL
jgi:uncharacterized protein (DUF2235 family)